ncbi:MAG: DHA2 family efflux MFS transporter permease subunit [Bdellovibrionota bacterium]
MTKTPESVKRMLPWLVAVAFFMEALDTTILNTAVPEIAKGLGVVPLSMKSALSSYTLSLAVFIPVSSWITDRFGTRRVFSTAIGIFTLGSILCGISNSIHLLVFCRVLQGCGGAMMVPVGRFTLVRTFRKSELIQAMSFVAIPALIGPLLGPLAGGFIVGVMNWRMIFFVNIPIGLAGLFLVMKHLPDYRATKADKLDIIGLILFGSGVALLSYVLEVFGEHSLSLGEVAGLFSLSLFLIAGYVVHAMQMARPILRLSLMRVRTFRTSITGNLISRLGMGGMPFLLPLMYQVGLGYSPLQSGLLIVPQSLAAMWLKTKVGPILTRFGYRHVLLTNTLIIGALMALFATIRVGTPAWLILLQSATYGFFSSLQYTCMNTLVYADIDDSDMSMASTIVSTAQQLALSFGVAAASLVTAYFLPETSRSAAREMMHGMHEAFITLGAFTALSALVFRELRNHDGDNISHHHGVEPEEPVIV